MGKQKVALVLSMGGARGIAHIGVIEELLRHNYEITSIAGSSMGAMVGAMYASGKLEECKEWLPSNDFRELGNPNENWTVQNGDFFIVGKWNGKERVNGIEEIKREFSGVTGKILSHSENFFGSSKHIRIGGSS